MQIRYREDADLYGFFSSISKCKIELPPVLTGGLRKQDKRKGFSQMSKLG